MNVRVSDIYDSNVVYDRIKVVKINREGLFTLVHVDGSRIIGSFEEVTSLQIDQGFMEV